MKILYNNLVLNYYSQKGKRFNLKGLVYNKVLGTCSFTM